MLDVLLGAVGAGTGLLSSLLGNASKNNQVDDLIEELKKKRYTEDQISRRQNEVKRTYGNTVDSMIGSAGFLNGDTARMIANSKIATQSAQAQIKERFALEDQNRQLDLKSAELSGQKIGTAGMLSSALMDTLNTGIQGYTTGSYLDMLNPTKNVTEDLTTEVLNRTVANANQPVDMTNINRDLGGFTNPQLNRVIEEQYTPEARVNPPTGRIPQFDYMNQGNNIPQESFNDYSAMTDYSKNNPYWRINDANRPYVRSNNSLQTLPESTYYPTRSRISNNLRQQFENGRQISEVDFGDELRGRPSNQSDNLDLSTMLLGNIMRMFDVNQNQDFKKKQKQLPFAKSYLDSNFLGGF